MLVFCEYSVRVLCTPLNGWPSDVHCCGGAALLLREVRLKLQNNSIEKLQGIFQHDIYLCAGLQLQSSQKDPFLNGICTDYCKNDYKSKYCASKKISLFIESI